MATLRFIVCCCMFLASLCAVNTANSQTDETPPPIPALEPPPGPLVVAIGIEIDQITFVDQKAENFGAVATIRMKWNDPRFQFDEKVHGRDYKVLEIDEFFRLAEDRVTVTPRFVVKNQQNKRWIQEAVVVVQSDGTVEYLEHSTVQLQAPYFDFRDYPFDHQDFFFEIVLSHPVDDIQFVAMEEHTGLGPLLGEEEWIFENPVLEISTTEGLTGEESHKATLGISGRRHVQYYFVRIFIPLLIMLIVSWACFFVTDYEKRIDIASANFLLFIAFNFAISGDLPRLGYITFVDVILMAMFLITGSLILVSVAIQRLAEKGRKPLIDRIDKLIVIILYPIGYALVIIFSLYYFSIL